MLDLLHNQLFWGSGKEAVGEQAGLLAVNEDCEPIDDASDDPWQSQGCR